MEREAVDKVRQSKKRKVVGKDQQKRLEMCFSVLHQLVQLSQQEEVKRHQRPQIEAEASEATKTEMV